MGTVVKSALEAVANVNGPPVQRCSFIVAVAIAGHVGMIEFLLAQKGRSRQAYRRRVATPTPKFGHDFSTPGERALHIAIRHGDIEIVRLLLGPARADPNVTEKKGRMPLIPSGRV